jgi:uncharacterized membrane protein
MTQLVLWMIMAYGMSNILVYGSIFSGTRNIINRISNTPAYPMRSFFAFLSDMLKCMMCISVWLGFFFGIFVYSPVHQILGITSWGSWFLDGMLSSGSVWAINSIIEWFEENRPKKD